MSIFNVKNFDATKQTCFFGEPVTIARFDKQRYPVFEKLTEKQNGFFWRPQEISLVKDKPQFRDLTFAEQHIAESNLKRQILLDSVQGRAPSVAFLPVCSLPELENFIQTWAYFENIHSRSYTYILRNVYPDPSKVFDELLDIQEIVDCAKDVSKYYDHLIEYTNQVGTRGTSYGDYGHKKALWLCLNAVNALEGIRFYVSFACSWAFAETNRLEGNAKIVKLIARDENIHLAATQQTIKILPKEDEDFARIQIETRDECIAMFHDVIAQEKKWAAYLFQYGPMIGLNERILCESVDHFGAKRMGAIGLNGKAGPNPIPWIGKWISGSEVQAAPQETEQESYTVGGIKNDVNAKSLKGFKL